MNVEMKIKDAAQMNSLVEVLRERTRQDKKWGSQRHLHDETWYTILGEEVGEVARAILEKGDDNLTEEIVQVCAVALAWLEGRV